MYKYIALLCKYSPLSSFRGRRWHAVSESLIRAQPERRRLLSLLLSFPRQEKWLLQQSDCDTESQSSIHNAWIQIHPLTWGMVPSPPAVQNATRPSSSHYNISGLEIVRRRHSRHTSVNKDPLLFSCTSPFYTAQVWDVHVQKEQVFLIKLKYVGCSQPLWHSFLRAARAASSWPYITASLIIAACVYLRSYCSFYIRKEFWAVHWPHTALVFFVFCHTGTGHLYLVQERLLILLAL